MHMPSLITYKVRSENGYGFFEARSENGCGKWHFSVWNWVWICRCGRHTPTKNSKEYPPGAYSVTCVCSCPLNHYVIHTSGDVLSMAEVSMFFTRLLLKPVAREGRGGGRMPWKALSVNYQQCKLRIISNVSLRTFALIVSAHPYCARNSHATSCIERAR